MFSHLDENNRPAAVDVSGKQPSPRTAHARAEIALPPEVAAALDEGEIQTPKGPVFHTAIIAGIMAAKNTASLIPLCHPLPLEDCKIDIAAAENRIVVDCRVKTHHKTGVEMEALTGASVAALAIYDMCKGLSHAIVIESVRLIEKRGGKSDYSAPAAEDPAPCQP